MLSDHFLVDINVSLQKQSVSAKDISYRRYKSIDKEAFLADLRVSSLVLDPPDDVDHLVDLYDNTLRDIVDQHAPLRTKEMPSRPMLPWYNKNIQAAKRHRRYCERLWIRTSLCVHFEMFKVSKILVKNTLASAKSEYYNRKIKASKGNQRTVFSVVNKVLHKSQTVLPNNINSDKDMAHCFNNFFCQKILNIHSGFQSSTLSQGKPLVEESCISMMDTFEPFTETDIRQLLKKSSNAFCAVDPMPTWLVKDCLDVLINPITNIVNKSLSLGVFPRSMKAALVKPLIKNHTLDCNILNNYRPVSNLTFLSKVIEKAVAFHLNKYLINNNLNESLQSAYKSGHSTETALVRVKNDIMMSIDQGKPVILVLLDLSAAFDTVDHNVLFSRLKDMFGLSGRVLEWFRSYLEQRSQRASVHGILSDIQFLLSGVPQGSVLGPLVFTMYTRPLGIIAQRYGVKYHLYADDTQLYISLDPDNELNFSSSLKNLEHCIADIRLWMTQNLLKLNDNKTNILYLASPHCVKSLKTPALQMGASSITPNGSVKNLGVIFDQCINMHEHVTSVCRAAYYHLKNIHCLKAFLTQESLLTVVHAFVTSRIDYCNSLLYGISDYNINRLQRIQNSAARIVTNTRKYDHITPILQKLHWLPVRQRIHFKILLITYKSINDMAPEYLCELVSIRKSSRKLRSSSQILLQVPVSRLKSYGDCAFSVAAPNLWNKLPANIRNSSSLGNFKSLLKTHLFKVAFTDK